MLILREREKLLEVIKYFAMHTKYCGLTKLFKLLFFLDFDHYRETGRSVTGLQYQAWPLGPVPDALYTEITGKHGDDLATHLHIEGPKEIEVPIASNQKSEAINSWGGESLSQDLKNVKVPAKIKAMKRFSPKLFTKRELRLMEQIAFMYKELTAAQISEVSHLKGKPWHITKTKLGLKAPINYNLALNENMEGAPSKEEILARIEERSEVLDAFK